ncbi:MAG: creatininase family protein [Caldilineaceae bacterium]
MIIKFGDLTYQEIAEKASQGVLAIVPTGCTEQQGPHLPVDFDTWFVEQVCIESANVAAAKYNVQALVLPVTPFGPTPEHRNYGSGYIDISQSIFTALVHSILTSLAQQGFRRIIVWRGCGGHQLTEVIQQFNKAQQGKVKAFLPDWPYHDIWRRIGDPNVAGGHADSFCTSIALCLRPNAVRRDKIKDPVSLPVDWSDPNLDFTHYSQTGVIGDPTYATAELGATLWHEIIETVALIIRKIALDSTTYKEKA